MSVFTYEPSIQRVMSPWLKPTCDGGRIALEYLVRQNDVDSLPAYYILTTDRDGAKLIPEPQDGPVEYKRHLLLESTQTAEGHAGSQSENRKSRFQRFTTQLLWRLHQSSPGLTTFTREEMSFLDLPDSIVGPPATIAKLAPGLETSQGALYELGVEDDGKLQGLTASDMAQSIATLQWMAAYLGCVVELVTDIGVGRQPPKRADEPAPSSGEPAPVEEPVVLLYVTELFIRPGGIPCVPPQLPGRGDPPNVTPQAAAYDQLRVTLAGPPNSGKSTLLATLLSGLLDDGHGRSRRNTFDDHAGARLQSVMGITIAQGLLGYNDDIILNHARPDINHRDAIRHFPTKSRLVLITDQEDFACERRAALTGLIARAPHWVFLCLSPSASSDAMNYLRLCLKVGLPLVVVVTKSDSLNKEQLRHWLGPIFDTVRDAGRTPRLLPHSVRLPGECYRVGAADTETVRNVVASILQSETLLGTVPVIMQSSVTGSGIGLIHGLLRALPLPPMPSANTPGNLVNRTQPAAVFQINEVMVSPHQNPMLKIKKYCKVEGILRFGRLTLHQIVHVGPFVAIDYHSDTAGDDSASDASDSDDSTSDDSDSDDSYVPMTREEYLDRLASVNTEAWKPWHLGHITSIDNLGKPVDTLEADQVGRLVLDLNLKKGERGTVRPGMVLLVPNRYMVDNDLKPEESFEFTAYFRDVRISRLQVNDFVDLYTAGIRRPAKVVEGFKAHPVGTRVGVDATMDESAGPVAGGNMSGPGPASDAASNSAEEQGYCVKFEVQSEEPLGDIFFSGEWFELGAQVIILERKDRSLLDGFVGRVLEVFA